ncbi:hypothetical protein RclHR1_04040001, partial [Rhizophagus clarus]
MNNALVDVELQSIIRRVTITILYTENIINDYSSVVICEILYKHRGHWKIRNVAYFYHHPSEFASLEEPKTSLPIYKLYIDLHYDNFGTFRNVYHSLGGVYIQIGNLPFDKRKQLKNHFVLGFIPFGGCFKEFIAPFVAEMKTLENGKIMNVQGTKSIVIASLRDITADLPQGNDLQFEEISAAPTMTKRKEITAEYGLCIQPSLLDKLKRERHLQSPHDIYHIIARKALRFLRITIDALSPEGKLAFILAWKAFEYPTSWRKLPNLISHIESFMISDSLRLAMVMLFILNRILNPQNFKQSEIDKFQSRTDVLRSDSAINLWLKCWILVAKTMSMAFMHSFTEEDYIKLSECLDKERSLLSQAFKDFENLLNLHANLHLAQHAKNYATLLNTGVGTKEMVHKIFKNIMPQTNRKNVDLDLLKRYTTLFAVRYLFDGSIEICLSSMKNALNNLPHHLNWLMDSWFIAERSFDFNDDISEVHSPDESITKITLKKHISRRKCKEILPNDADFRIELAMSYRDIGYHSAIFGTSYKFYEYAYFFAEENDTNVLHRLHIGEVVTIVTDECETFA